MSSEILTIENLHYWYTQNWTGRKIHALKGVSVEVSNGEAFGFLGHNGSGKTTTIKNILGLVRHQQGNITICGRSSLEPAARQSVGYVPEYPYFYDYLTVNETMLLMAGLCGVERAEMANRVEHALKLVKFSKAGSSRLRTLSKGLLQRVAIAQAIVHSPQLLILDEPFSGLDPVGRREIRDLFELLKSQGTSLFISSHILSDVEHLCDRASIMVNGQIKGVFNLRDDLCREEDCFELVLSDSDEHDAILKEFSAECLYRGKLQRWMFTSKGSARNALKLLLESSADIESFMRIRSRLEDTFIELIKK
jgi:ABC-2 type transport system ATP-binding protein